MVGCRLFRLINIILKQVFNNDLSFGGLSVLLCGDIGQLLPVNDIPIWASQSDSDSDLIRESKELFGLFTVNYKLTRVMRQIGPEQHFLETC